MSIFSLQLHFTMAVDFTTNNGNQTETTSLHFQDPIRRSIYDCRLKVIAECIESYSPSSKISLLGFGANIPPEMQFSQCFALVKHGSIMEIINQLIILER